MQKENLKELMEKELAVGYVFRYDNSCQLFYFEKSPANIANFIMGHKEHTDKMILTDIYDRPILDTFGDFINKCPDKELLQEILYYLIPMQLGENESENVLVASEQEYQKLLYEEDVKVTKAEMRMQ